MQPDSEISDPAQRLSASARAAWLGEVATVVYIAVIALIATGTGFSYVLFPELGALSHDIFKRPHGIWAKAPLMLIVTPLLTALIGTLVTRHLAYGMVSVFLVVGSAMLVIRLLGSPIAPAISAGLLPLTLGVRSWSYPVSILAGTILLAGISLVWRRIMPGPAPVPSGSDLADDLVEQAPRDYSWTPFFLAFLFIASLAASLTGWRFLLFPPLVVIGFEMFAHASTCPWAGRPLILPVACTLSAAAGVILVTFFGVGPLAAACSIAVGIGILRLFDLHVPPALAVGLLPFVMARPSWEFPLAVAAGTLLLTMSFLLWRRLSRHQDA